MSMWGDMGHKLVTPNEVYAQAKTHMLDGRNPVNHDDYALIVNFIAANLLPEIAANACELMRVIFEMPLTADEVKEIVEFQLREHN